ncbi:MAG: hypothetical protein ACRDRK_16065, partial [Pseudonocardia sp.]
MARSRRVVPEPVVPEPVVPELVVPELVVPGPSMSGSVGGHNIQIGSAAGDVVILLDRPMYRLEFLTPTGARLGVVPRSQRRKPSYLLDPQREAVPYRARPVDEAAIAGWLDEPSEDVSVLWMSGPGGQGKTRLAGHVA